MPILGRILAALVLASACGAPAAPSPAAPPADETMAPFQLNGYELTGAEYWPYVGSADLKYPEEVLWGFYPEAGVVPPGETEPNPATARPEAVACAKQAWTALRAYLASDPPKLRRIIELAQLTPVVVPRFYLWTNDYGRAADPYPPGVREARLWWWKRKQPEPPKPPGYWKWEATLTQRGECLIPQRAQADAYVAEMLAAMERSIKSMETMPRPGR